jgi:hypothetical protein
MLCGVPCALSFNLIGKSRFITRSVLSLTALVGTIGRTAKRIVAAGPEDSSTYLANANSSYVNAFDYSGEVVVDDYCATVLIDLNN